MSPVASTSGHLRARSTSVEQNPHYSTPPTSDEEKLLGPGRAHFRTRFHEINALGAGANAETFLVVGKKAAARIRMEIEKYDQQSFFDALRKQVFVVKVAKEGPRRQADLTVEMDFNRNMLAHTGAKVAVPVVQALGGYRKGDTMWMTMRLAKGGELCEFIKEHKKSLTLGFRWHMAHQLANALAYVFYGVTNLSTATPTAHTEASWCASHGDVHTGNMLLTSSAQGSYRDYPDLKLADFGRAQRYAPRPDTPLERRQRAHAAIKSEQHNDWNNACNVLLGMSAAHHFGQLCPMSHDGPRADCTECTRIARLYRVEGLRDEERAYFSEVSHAASFNFRIAIREEGMQFLKDFAETAARMRERFYAPLSAGVRAALDAEKVSDHELDDALGLGLLQD